MSATHTKTKKYLVELERTIKQSSVVEVIAASKAEAKKHAMDAGPLLTWTIDDKRTEVIDAR
jgi:hypothetical protein